MVSLLNILNLQVLLLMIFGLIIAYLIVRRIQIKKNEDFEDRDN